MSDTQVTLTGEQITEVGHVTHNEIDVYVGRIRVDEDTIKALGAVSIWDEGWLGNPYTVDEWGRETAIAKYRKLFETKIEQDEEFREAIADLQGKTLGCYCQTLSASSPKCHAEVIAEWAERLGTDGGWG